MFLLLPPASLLKVLFAFFKTSSRLFQLALLNIVTEYDSAWFVYADILLCTAAKNLQHKPTNSASYAG